MANVIILLSIYSQGNPSRNGTNRGSIEIQNGIAMDWDLWVSLQTSEGVIKIRGLVG